MVMGCLSPLKVVLWCGLWCGLLCGYFVAFCGLWLVVKFVFVGGWRVGVWFLHCFEVLMHGFCV